MQIWEIHGVVAYWNLGYEDIGVRDGKGEADARCFEVLISGHVPTAGNEVGTGVGQWTEVLRNVPTQNRFSKRDGGSCEVAALSVHYY